MASREKWGKLGVRRQINSGYFERYALSNTKVSPLATQLPAKIARCRVPLNRSPFYM
jgi:predicted nuclease of restriction endonuclease-like (RecB) superfamily